MDKKNQPNRNVYSLESMHELPICTVIRIDQMSPSKRITFESDSQNAGFYREFYNCKFDSFFVEVNEAGDEYTQVWGMMGVVPSDDNCITKIFKA